MSDITLPIVIFDRHHLLFFLSHTHAVNYIKQSPSCCHQLSIFDSKGQVLSYQTDDETHSRRQKLVLIDNAFVCKATLLEKFHCFLQFFKIPQTLSENLSANQLILLIYRLF